MLCLIVFLVLIHILIQPQGSRAENEGEHAEHQATPQTGTYEGERATINQ